MPEEKITCYDCKKEIEKQPEGSCTTGYGSWPINPDRKTYVKICFPCCAVRDLADMKKESRVTLYLKVNSPPSSSKIINWPGSLSLPIDRIKQVKFRGRYSQVQRTDVWFTDPHGNKWHGVNQGDNDIARCKKLGQRRMVR